MAKVFTKPYEGGFKDYPDESTPITADVMDAVVNGLDALDNKVDGMESGAGEDNIDFSPGSGKRKVGFSGNRPVYEEDFSVETLTSTETILTPDAAFYRLLSATGSADLSVNKNDVVTNRLAIPYSMGEQYANVMEDSSVKSSRKIVLRTDSVDYSNVNIALKYLGKLQTSQPCTWADGTPEEISTLLEAHYDGDFNVQDVWNIGEERNVVVDSYTDDNNNNCPVTNYKLILVNKGGKMLAEENTECAFVFAFNAVIRGDWRRHANASSGYSNSQLRTYVISNVFYNKVEHSIRQHMKKFINKQTGIKRTIDESVDFLSPPDEFEFFGTNTRTINIPEQEWFEWFQTVDNRRKVVDSSMTNIAAPRVMAMLRSRDILDTENINYFIATYRYPYGEYAIPGEKIYNGRYAHNMNYGEGGPLIIGCI